MATHNDLLDARGYRFTFETGSLGTNQDILTGNLTLEEESSLIQSLNPNGADRIITLPSFRRGAFFTIENAADVTTIFKLIVVDSALNTVITIEPKQTANIFSRTDRWSASKSWANLAVFGPSGVNHSIGLVPDPGVVIGATRFLREDGQWGSVHVTGIVDSFKYITDGVTQAVASGPDTFKFRSSDASVNTIIQNNDATHGDNVNLTINAAGINHNLLLNYIADQHVAHSGIDIIAGIGLNGGGTINASRTINLAFEELLAVVPVAADIFPFRAAVGGAHNSVTLSILNANIAHDSLAGYVASRHVDHTTVVLSAGIGISGGGDISASRSFSLDLTELPTVDLIVAGDLVPFYDSSGLDHGTNTLSQFVTQLGTAGLGTAAYQSIGTSGANVPLLNAANTHVINQVFQNVVILDKAGAQLAMPSSYAAADAARLAFYEADVTGGFKRYLDIVSSGGLGSAAAWIRLFTNTGAGGAMERMRLGEGAYMFGATSGDMGAGTVNATTFYKNGVALGTAAMQNIGTSGATVPLLNGANDWTAKQRIVVSSAGAVGPILELNNSNGALNDAGAIDFVDGGLRGRLKFSVDASPFGADLTYYGGASGITEIFRAHNGGGMIIGAPTGGAQGAGTLNATGLFINGVAIGGSSKWTQTGSDISFSTGRVSIGTATPVAGVALNITGNVQVNSGYFKTTATNGALEIGQAPASSFLARYSSGLAVDIPNVITGTPVVYSTQHNYIRILNDQVDAASQTGEPFVSGFGIAHTFGGGLTNGARSGFNVLLFQNGAIAAASTYNGHSAVVGNVVAAVSEGTAAVPKGSYFGINGYTQLRLGIHAENATGVESNVETATGCTVLYRSGIQIAATGSVRGSVTDAAVSISNLGGAGTTWKHGILFGAQNGGTAFGADSVAIKLNETVTIESIFDFNTVTSNFILKTPRLTLRERGGRSEIYMNKNASGSQCNIWSQTNGSDRWALQFGDETAESGANVGSDWRLLRYADTSAFLAIAMYVTRSNGYVGISEALAVGNPVGGHKGTGTINAVAVYDDNVLLTDYVFDKFYGNSIPDYSPKVMSRYEDLNTDMFNLVNYVDYWKTNKRLYGMPDVNDCIDGKIDLPLGAMIQRLNEVVELQAIHDNELLERIVRLEEQVQTLH